MAAPTKLIHNIEPDHLVSGPDKHSRIARECHRITGHMGNDRNLGTRNLGDLGGRTRSWRIDYDGVISRQFVRQKRAAKEMIRRMGPA